MTPSQCRVARALLDWSVSDLVGKLRGKVSTRTLGNYERGVHDALPETVAAIERVLTAAGIEFAADGVNVTLQPKAKGRKA